MSNNSGRRGSNKLFKSHWSINCDRARFCAAMGGKHQLANIIHVGDERVDETKG